MSAPSGATVEELGEAPVDGGRDFDDTAAVTDRASLFASYDGGIHGGTDNHALRVGFRLTW